MRILVTILLLMTAGIASAQSSASAAGGQSARPTGQIDFQMRFDGIYPKAITVTPGTYWVVFSNGVFRAPLNLVVARSGAAAALAQTASASAVIHRQKLTVTLVNGQYSAQVVGHPGWSAVITVANSDK